MNSITGIVEEGLASVRAPKYHQIKEHILAGIKSGEFPPDSQLPSEAELSRRFGVNQNTAKKALRELALQKHIYRVQGKGSYVSPTTRTKKQLTKTIALVVNNIRDPFYSKVVAAVTKCIGNYDNDLIFCDTGGRFDLLKKNVLGLIDNEKVDGFIICTVELSRNPAEHVLYDNMLEDGIPLVLLYPQWEIPDVDVIENDYHAMTFEAIRQLIGNGCKSIGFVTHPDVRDISIARSIDGYKDALADAGIAFDESLIIKARDTSFRAGYSLAEKLLEQDKLPDAFFTVTDNLSIGMYRCFRQAGIAIPDQVKLLTAGSIDMTSDPDLQISSISNDIDWVGDQALKLLMQRIKGNKQPPQHLIVPHQLHIRATSGKEIPPKELTRNDKDITT